jgi:hypothetical protein
MFLFFVRICEAQSFLDAPNETKKTRLNARLTTCSANSWAGRFSSNALEDLARLIDAVASVEHP